MRKIWKYIAQRAAVSWKAIRVKAAASGRFIKKYKNVLIPVGAGGLGIGLGFLLDQDGDVEMDDAMEAMSMAVLPQSIQAVLQASPGTWEVRDLDLIFTAMADQTQSDEGSDMLLRFWAYLCIVPYVEETGACSTYMFDPDKLAAGIELMFTTLAAEGAIASEGEVSLADSAAQICKIAIEQDERGDSFARRNADFLVYVTRAMYDALMSDPESKQDVEEMLGRPRFPNNQGTTPTSSSDAEQPLAENEQNPA